jgi:hypothetical protein
MAGRRDQSKRARVFDGTVITTSTNRSGGVSMCLTASTSAVHLIVSGVGRVTGGRGSAALREEARTLWIAREERLAPPLDGALAEGAGSVPLL